MWWYLFYASSVDLPQQYKGSAADPTTFMTSREVELSYEYSRLKHFLFFIRAPFEWLVLAAIIVFSLSEQMHRLGRKVTKRKTFQLLLYVFGLATTLFLANLPLKWISFQVSRSYGVSVTPFVVWIKDNFTSFGLNYVMFAVIAAWLTWMLKKSPRRWWLYSWLVSVPLTFFLIFLQPVLIDPLYNEFSTLQNKELEEKILTLAEEAEIPAEHVYEVQMSKKTNALNAYVNGIGTNARIVLWDTTLAQLSEKSILFIMAHEMAHYVYKHVFIGVSAYLLFSFSGFWVIGKLVKGITREYGELLHLNRNVLNQLPIILLLFSILAFISSPFSNYVSREMERSADTYAIELTEDKTAAIEAFQTLTIKGLSEVKPPMLVYWFRYGHPTMLERLNKITQFTVEE